MASSNNISKSGWICKEWELPPLTSLFSQKGEEFLHKLETFVSSPPENDKNQHPQIMILRQSCALRDQSMSWANELREGIFAEEIAVRLLSFRRVLGKLKQSSYLWVYAGSYDCMGSFWDLALSCSVRIWFGKIAKIGFPEIASGCFPLGGYFESTDSVKRKKQWEGKPIYSLMEAEQENFIDFWCEEEYGSSRICEWVARHPKLLEKNVETSIPILDQESFKDLLTPKKATLSTGIWQLSIPLLKTKEFSVKEKEIDLINYSSYYFFQDKHQEFLLKFQSSYIDLNEHKLGCIYIDMDGFFPSVESLILLIKAKSSLVFFASSNEHLFLQIKKISNALENEFLEKTAKIWSQQITWFVSQDKPQGLTLKWAKDGILSIYWQRVESRIWSVPDCKDKSWAEFLQDSQKTTPEVEWVCRLLFKNTLSRDFYVNHKVPLFIAIYSLFLQEVCKYAYLYHIDVTDLFSILQASGWTKVENKEWWDKFLLNRKAFAMPHTPLQEDFPLSSKLFAVGSIKELARVLNQHSSKAAKLEPLIPAQINQFLLLFAGVLVKALSKHSWVEDPSSFIKYLFGLPVHPLLYMEQYGERRLPFVGIDHGFIQAVSK
jgi:hypothetical protein